MQRYCNSLPSLYMLTFFVSTADIDECVEATARCDADASCTNTIGGYNCLCNSGYEGDGSEGSCNSEFFFHMLYKNLCISICVNEVKMGNNS